MKPDDSVSNATIIDITGLLKRKRDVASALSSEDYQQLAESFRWAGIELDEKNAEIAGRMLAGKLSLAEARALIEVRRSGGEASSDVGAHRRSRMDLIPREGR